MKKIIALVLCVLLIGALAVTAFAADDTKITVTADKTVVKPGDTVNITVTMTGTDKLTSMGYVPYNDSAYFTIGKYSINRDTLEVPGNPAIVNFTKANGLAVGGFTDWNTEEDIAVTLDGVILTFAITVKADAPAGKFNISKDANVKNGAAAVAFDLIDAELEILCEHTYGAWTEADAANHKQTCSKCGDEKTAAHAWDAGKVTKEPDCKNAGEKTFTCTGCSATKTESVAATGKHNYTGATDVDATNHELTCSGCGDKKTEAHAWNAGTVTTEPTCKLDGEKTLTCTACAATKTEVVPATGAHNYVNPVKVDDTNHKLTCGCGEEKLVAHTMDKGTVTTEPTCKDTGVKTFKCTACEHATTETLEKTDDHKYGAWTAAGEENHKKVCSVCAKEETAAHAWGEGEVAKEPTCKEEGTETFKCADCGATKTEALPVTEDHKSDEWTKVDGDTHKGTCSVCEKEVTVDHEFYAEFDEKTHWGVCACGEKLEAEAHVMIYDYNDELHVQFCEALCGYHTEVVEHKWDEGTVTKKPTTTTVGEKTFKCECGATKTEEVAKIATPATGDNNMNAAFVVLAVMATCGLALSVIGKKRFAR